MNKKSTPSAPKKAAGSPRAADPKQPKSQAALQHKADIVLVRMAERYPHPETHLEARSPWELLVATVLAAQCTDARVNTVTPGLFARWPGPAELAQASLAELEAVVRPTGFYHNKAKNLIAAAQKIMAEHGGKVPHNMAQLITLPGVARKTANVVLWGGFGINEGLAVDTHVGRITYRLGLATTHDPKKTEKELMQLFPQNEWGNINHRLVWFGRDVCDARKPLCSQCELAPVCDQRDVERHG